MMNWLFNGEPFDPNIHNIYEAFVYLIINKTNGKKYIGKKKMVSRRKLKGKTRRTTLPSDWENYWSSSDTLKKEIELLGKENFERHILSLHITWGDAGYEELRLQFLHDVLNRDDFYNEVIGKYRKSTKRILEGRKYSVKGLL